MELYTRAQAAEHLGVTIVTIDSERKAGRLAYIQRKKGGKVWITGDAIRDYLSRGTHEAKPERTTVVGPYNTFRKRRK